MVTSDVGGLGDLMREFAVGVTFHEATPDRLIAAIHALYAQGSHADLTAQITAAKQHYSWEAAARETVIGYSAALEGRREPAHVRDLRTHPAH